MARVVCIKEARNEDRGLELGSNPLHEMAHGD